MAIWWTCTIHIWFPNWFEILEQFPLRIGLFILSRILQSIAGFAGLDDWPYKANRRRLKWARDELSLAITCRNTGTYKILERYELGGLRYLSLIIFSLSRFLSIFFFFCQERQWNVASAITVLTTTRSAGLSANHEWVAWSRVFCFCPSVQMGNTDSYHST